MATFTNTNRATGNVETVTIPQSKAELLLMFEDAPNDHWLWFHLAKWCRENGPEARAERQQRVDMIAFLADSFTLAVGMGLKRPMIRLHYRDRRFKVYLSQRGTLCFKSGGLAVDMSCPTGSPVRWTNDPVGDEEYVGCLWAGKFLPNKQRQPLPTEVEVIARLSADPAGFLSQCSKDMDRCVYCGKPLEDQRSKDVGYGATCADRWGLPWGRTYDEKVPSFADLWRNSSPTDQRSIRGICATIRQNPYDPLSWDVLGDALEDAGWRKRPSCPDRAVKVCCS